MLSRRNIRIKVMKSLYAMNRDDAYTKELALRQYQSSINGAFDIYLFNLLQIVKIAEYAKKDAAIRAAKLLPTEEDKTFVPRLSENAVVNAFQENPHFHKRLKDRKLRFKIDPDFTRRYYQDFLKEDSYKDYMRLQEPSTNDHQKILLELFKFCIKNEDYEDMMEDMFNSWEDDKSLVIGAVKKTLKSLPTPLDFTAEHLPDEEATMEYGLELLHKTIFFDESLLDIIRPVLKNWEAERVAVIDMILIKLALCELLHFPTIPPKVTINEYVEVAKMYSTPKSKDFVNGVIDRLTKQLTEEGKIVKSGRGLLE